MTSDQNPLIQIYSLPPPAGGRILPPGTRSAALTLDLTNNSIAAASGAEQIVLDGETYRAAVLLSYGVGERIEAGVIVPVVAHRGGTFDHFIEEWHRIFGLSNRKRTSFGHDRLLYRYTGETGDGVSLTEPAGGLGDIRLTAAYRLSEEGDPDRALALRAGIKLPTGRAAELLGSGSTDLALRLAGTDEAAMRAWNTQLSWSLGGLWLGPGEVLDAMRHDLIAIAHVGVARPLGPALAVKAQLDAHSPFYDSSLAPLGGSGLQLSVGGAASIGRTTLDFALLENLFTDTIPDLVFHLAWRGLL